MRVAVLALLLASCATPLPPKDVYVKWDTPPCGEGPELRRIKFVDTWTPTIACVAASSGPDATKIVLLSLIGMPVVACAVTMWRSDGSAGFREESTTIYAPITPSLTQVLVTATTFASPNTVLEHEIEHAFGKSADHSGKCRPQ